MNTNTPMMPESWLIEPRDGSIDHLINGNLMTQQFHPMTKVDGEPTEQIGNLTDVLYGAAEMHANCIDSLWASSEAPAGADRDARIIKVINNAYEIMASAQAAIVGNTVYAMLPYQDGARPEPPADDSLGRAGIAMALAGAVAKAAAKMIDNIIWPMDEEEEV